MWQHFKVGRDALDIEISLQSNGEARWKIALNQFHEGINYRLRPSRISFANGVYQIEQTADTEGAYNKAAPLKSKKILSGPPRRLS